MDDTKNTSDDIIEAEIVEEAVETTTDANAATVLLSLEQLIKHHISSVEKNQIELRKLREQLADSFENDPVYREHAEKAKEAAKVRSQTKQQITGQPAIIILSNKVKSLSQELKELQFSLSDYLKEYQRMTGANEIEGEDGELREIVNTAKLIKKSSRGK